MMVMLFAKVVGGIPPERLAAANHARTVAAQDEQIRDLREELDLATDNLGNPIQISRYKTCRCSYSCFKCSCLMLG